MLTACKGELPNPYKDNVRRVLDALICRFNDFQRINIQLRNTRDEYEIALRESQFRCNELQRRNVCGEELPAAESRDHFRTLLKTKHEVNECFDRRIEQLSQERDEIVKMARECLVALSKEKCRLKSFHENTIDHLKRYIHSSKDRQLVRKAEKDICEMHMLFSKEVSYIKKCEDELLPFLKQIEDCETQCRMAKCSFKDYECLSQEQQNFDAVSDIADKIKTLMGHTLIKAFALMHIQQPADPSSFLAAYFSNLDRVEKLAAEKVNLLTAKCPDDCKQPCQLTCVALDKEEEEEGEARGKEEEAKQGEEHSENEG